jgi:hypothetical protein
VRKSIAALALAISGLVSVTTADAAEINYVFRDDHQGINMVIKGNIEEGDAHKFNDVRRTVQATLVSSNVTVILNSYGGSVYEALSIASAIREMNWSTWVQTDSDCNSSCALIWLAGNIRYATETSLVGFHAAYNGQTKAESGAANAVVGAFYKELGFKDEAIYYLTMAPPEQSIFLTEESADKYGIAHSGKLPSEGSIQLLIQTALANKPQAEPESQPTPRYKEDRIATTVTDDLILRREPSPSSANMLKGQSPDFIPRGTTIEFPVNPKCWFNGQFKTTWCRVDWTTNGRVFKGWVRAFYLKSANSNNFACTFKPWVDYACNNSRQG